MTRTEDILEYDETAKSNTDKRRQDLKRRKKIMDESNADIVVSIHMNKFDNPTMEHRRSLQKLKSSQN